jgi:hypothetical protein
MAVILLFDPLRLRAELLKNFLNCDRSPRVRPIKKTKVFLVSTDNKNENKFDRHSILS